MKTWQGFTADTGTATTRWNYNAYRGWLQSKDYPDAATGQPPGTEGTGGPVYTYKPSGRMETRVWKRGVTTTYAYNTGGDLSTVTYSGGVSTPSSTTTYDRRGRRLTALRNSITTTFAYNNANLLLSETHVGGTLANLSTVRAYDTSLRPQTAQIKNGANILQGVTYAYDTAGRLQTVTDASASAYTATYGYHSNSALIDTVTFKQNSTNRLVTTRTYDRLNRLTSIRSTAYGTGAPALPVAFDYTYNAANQRTRMNLADGSYWVY